MSKPKILLLNSGGADSIACLHLLHQTGYDVHSVFYDYGQPNKNEEWRLAVKHTLKYVGNTSKIEQVNLTLSSNFENKAYEAKDQEIYLRNFVFLSHATQIAYTKGIGQIAMGYLNFQDMGDYVDDNPLLLQTYHKMISQFFGIRLLTPIAGYEKELVYTTLLDAGIDPATLPYCNTPENNKPCGNCHKCKFTEEILTKLKETRQ